MPISKEESLRRNEELFLKKQEETTKNPSKFYKTQYPTRFIVMEQHKYIYSPIPKAACSTIKTILLSVSNQPIVKEIHQLANFNYVIDGDISDEKFREYFKFAFVRNPWDRIVSCYIDKVLCPPEGHEKLFRAYSWYRPDLSFEAFVVGISQTPDRYSDEHFKSQHSFLTNKSGEIAMDYIGKFEHLEQDMKDVFEKMGIPRTTEIPHLNQAKQKTKHYSEYYTERTKDMISQRYKKDIELFGYSFEQK